MNIWVKIGLIIIVLHLLVGFGWLFYKLAIPPKKKKDDQTTDSTDSKTS